MLRANGWHVDESVAAAENEGVGGLVMMDRVEIEPEPSHARDGQAVVEHEVGDAQLCRCWERSPVWSGNSVRAGGFVRMCALGVVDGGLVV